MRKDGRGMDGGWSGMRKSPRLSRGSGRQLAIRHPWNSTSSAHRGDRLRCRRGRIAAADRSSISSIFLAGAIVRTCSWIRDLTGIFHQSSLAAECS